MQPVSLASVQGRSPRIGLVLGGGAALGAYHVGVYKVIREMVLDKNIVAISGTSVGALSAVMVKPEDLTTAYAALWQGMQCNLVLDGLGELMCKGLTSDAKGVSVSTGTPAPNQAAALQALQADHRYGLNASQDPLGRDLSEFASLGRLSCGPGISTEGPLRKTAESFAPKFPQLLSPGATPIYITRVRAQDEQLQYVTQVNKSGAANIVTFTSVNNLVDNLMASAAAKPLFSCYTIDGVAYRDGGQTGGNNLPYQILESEEKVDKLILVSITSDTDEIPPASDKYVPIKLDPSYDKTLNLIHFKADFAQKLIALGEADARRILGAAFPKLAVKK